MKYNYNREIEILEQFYQEAIELIKTGLTQNISQTLFSSFSSFLRGSLFRDLCVSPIKIKRYQKLSKK